MSSPLSNRLPRMSRFVLLLSKLTFGLMLSWFIVGVPVIAAHWPADGERRVGSVVLLTHVIDAEDAKPKAPKCWVPYYDTVVLSPVHLEVDRVLAGEFPHAQLECLDHLHRLDKKNTGPALGLRIELDWSHAKGLYIVRDHRPVTLLGTLLVYVLPALFAFGLLLGVWTFVRRGRVRYPDKNRCGRW